MKTVTWIATLLIVVGAINWGLTAIGFNVVDAIFGAGSVLSQVIYILVGISGIWGISMLMPKKQAGM